MSLSPTDTTVLRSEAIKMTLEARVSSDDAMRSSEMKASRASPHATWSATVPSTATRRLKRTARWSTSVLNRVCTNDDAREMHSGCSSETMFRWINAVTSMEDAREGRREGLSDTRVDRKFMAAIRKDGEEVEVRVRAHTVLRWVVDVGSVRNRWRISVTEG